VFEGKPESKVKTWDTGALQYRAITKSKITRHNSAIIEHKICIKLISEKQKSKINKKRLIF
jgi:hypothetical protein